MRRFPVLTVVLAAALIAAAFLFFERFKGPEKPEPRDKGRQEYTAPRKSIAPVPTETKPYRQIAIIIDDIGFDMQALRRLAEIPAPLAFAVLPHTPYAVEAAEFLHKGNRDILLHLPMEPLSYPNHSPGAGALMADMDEMQIIRRLSEDFTAVPHVSGVNSHMGSRFMEDALRLKIVMEELKKRGLYFVDSRTSPHSQGREAAVEVGIRFAARDIFIDHENGYESALKTLRQAAAREIKDDGKPLLLIGHPHADTIRALEAVLPLWKKEGIRIVEISRCLNNPQ